MRYATVEDLKAIGICRPDCSGCGCSTGMRHGDACPAMAQYRVEWLRTHCGAKPERHQETRRHGREPYPANGSEVCGEVKGHHGEHYNLNYGRAWTIDAPIMRCFDCGGELDEYPLYRVDHRQDGADRRLTCSACETRRAQEASPVCPGCGGRGTRIERGLVWNAVHPAACPNLRAFNAGERRASEVPLVALVNAAPSWADPVAWRAAVLASHEHFAMHGTHAQATMNALAPLADWLDRNRVLTAPRANPDSAFEAAWHAYRRALAPRVKVAPERRRNAYPVVVDHGED